METTLQSNSNLSSISEQKYINLRKRLDQLGYRQTLGIESLPLIEKLFNDLVHTTESLKKSKLEATKTTDQNASIKTNDSNLSTSNIQAYKTDNAKLIKENNELHIEFIKLKEEYETKLKDMKSSLRKLEHENSDLRFLNTQYIHKLRAIEKESKDKSKKILELQEKNFQAVIQTPNGNKQTIPFRRQRLDIDCMLPARSEDSSIFTPRSITDPYVIDMIKMADDRIAQLQSDLELTRQSVDLMDTKLSNYKNQVENRDKEIERLHRLLDGGRPYDVVSLEGKLRNNEKLISHQNLQIEYLQEKNHQLEKRLEEYIDAKRSVINEKLKNDELVKDINQINRLAKRADFEKKVTVEAADRELSEAKFEIQRSREELNNLDTAVHSLNLDKINLIGEVEDLRLKLKEQNANIDNLRALVDKIQDDKVKLSKKVSKLLENEKELVQELDNVKARRANSAGRNKTQTVNKNGSNLTVKLDSYIKNIESERDFFKKEVDTLNELLKSINHTPSSSNGSPIHKSRKETESKMRRSISHSPVLGANRCTVCNTSIHRGSKSPSPNRHQQKSILKSASNNAFDESDLIKVMKERDELKCLLDKFERHMAEIQANVKVLTNERDKINQLYEETRDELQKTRRELLKSPKAPNVSLAAQTILKRVENERDGTLFELRSITNDRDSLKERLKIVTETSISEKAKLEQQIEDLQIMYKNSDLEKMDLYQQLDLFKNQIDQIENKFRSQSYQLSQTIQELNDQKSASTQIRLLAEESERALEEQRRQISIKHEEINMLQQINLKLEQKLMDFQELNRSLKDELNALRLTISSMDKDKDKLITNVDEKTEENVTLKHELSSKHHRLDELNHQLSQLDTELDRANNEIKQKNKEITSLRIQIDRENEEMSTVNRKFEVALRENKRLQDDLITMTRENQVLHLELDKTNMEKERLKDQAQDYINEVSKFEELLNQKEHDRSSLLDQYRETSNELSKMKMTLNAFETEVSNLKIELQMKLTENKRLKERVDSLERDNQQQISICQEYEVKLSNLNRNLQRHEEALKKYQFENNDIMQELMHSRELNQRVEMAKEELTRHLTSKELDNEQLQNMLADLKAESDLLKSQINSERTMVKNLEDLISNNREKEFHTQLSSQERDAEINLLKDRISLSEQKLQTQNKEISSLRTKIVEYETENERLKRQLTNERFERERAAQELRKLSDSVEINSSRIVRNVSPPKVSFTSSSSFNNNMYSRSRSRSPENGKIGNTMKYSERRVSPNRTN